MRVFRRAPEVRSPNEEPLRFTDSASTYSFADVAGLDEVIAELRDIVDYLADPARFDLLGARAPTGILLHGEPGCGKTLLGRALAGEVGVPFYFVSATSFVERFVGLGASRVRELFDTAGADAPCIVFLDEIDAAGRRRSDGAGDREFDHTLNQLLVELDGFLGATGVVTLAATNRLELLDPALVRPGRFDRKIAVPLPGRNGRLAVLRLHAGARPCEPEVDWSQVADATAGRSPAELANLVNEAALLAARRRAVALAWADVEEALERLAQSPTRTGCRHCGVSGAD
ncbi:AAA family ATPase [Sporichthya polymorpha]|uniref:AAA family ATPase n=1 Tax=Sporichthya polymorpha TaxID=35751 RepID=UPI0003651D49|nr:AAA family ATPase [Sporichthya polymorpha]